MTKKLSQLFDLPETPPEPDKEVNEALKTIQDNQQMLAQVDAAIENAGFKMGPFKLMDLIGMDVNLAVSTSLYEAFNNAIRFKPSALQIEKVKKKSFLRGFRKFSHAYL